MYIFKSDINKNEYDHFVENHPSCNLLQSYDWANIKIIGNPFTLEYMKTND